jgi:hypothetical protein
MLREWSDRETPRSRAAAGQRRMQAACIVLAILLIASALSPLVR